MRDRGGEGRGAAGSALCMMSGCAHRAAGLLRGVPAGVPGNTFLTGRNQLANTAWKPPRRPPGGTGEPSAALRAERRGPPTPNLPAPTAPGSVGRWRPLRVPVLSLADDITVPPAAVPGLLPHPAPHPPPVSLEPGGGGGRRTRWSGFLLLFPLLPPPCFSIRGVVHSI